MTKKQLATPLVVDPPPQHWNDNPVRLRAFWAQARQQCTEAGLEPRLHTAAVHMALGVEHLAQSGYSLEQALVCVSAWLKGHYPNYASANPMTALEREVWQKDLAERIALDDILGVKAPPAEAKAVTEPLQAARADGPESAPQPEQLRTGGGSAPGGPAGSTGARISITARLHVNGLNLLVTAREGVTAEALGAAILEIAQLPRLLLADQSGSIKTLGGIEDERDRVVLWRGAKSVEPSPAHSAEAPAAPVPNTPPLLTVPAATAPVAHALCKTLKRVTNKAGKIVVELYSDRPTPEITLRSERDLAALRSVVPTLDSLQLETAYAVNLSLTKRRGKPTNYGGYFWDLVSLKSMD